MRENISHSGNPVRVMVVDDSAVIRGLFAKLLNSDPDIDVVTTASNGEMAVNLLKSETNKIDVDIITLDIEMPKMDGMTALPKLLKYAPNAKIIMVSSLISEKDASKGMEALSSGATDCISKPVSTRDRTEMQNFANDLLNKVKKLGGKRSHIQTLRRGKIPPKIERIEVVVGKKVAEAEKREQEEKDRIELEKISLRKRPLASWKPDAIVIGSSTGGPQALASFFSALGKKKFSIPIFITQHMPAQFTTLLAKQINNLSTSECTEGKDMEVVKSGNIYLAPGNNHMILEKKNGNTVVRITQDPPENFCRPAVDPLLRSANKVYDGKLLVIIFTGMGADGAIEAENIANNGGVVIAQDKKTSVVWGMPGAVATAGVCTKILPLDKLPDCAIDLACGQIS